jgi:hypothetical protein
VNKAGIRRAALGIRRQAPDTHIARPTPGVSASPEGDLGAHRPVVRAGVGEHAA